MKQAGIFLCAFLIPISLCGFLLAENVVAQWEKTGLSVAYDYPWRSIAIYGHFSHRVQLDVSKNVITVYTEALSGSDLTDFAAYAADLQSLFSASGFGETRLLFEGTGFASGKSGTIHGWLLTDISILPFCFLLDSHGLTRLVFDLSYEANLLNGVADPLLSGASLAFPGARAEELERIVSEENAFHRMQRYQETILENQLQKTKTDLSDQTNALLHISELNNQLLQRIRALEETVATFEASESAVRIGDERKRIESDAFQEQGRQLAEADVRIKKLEESLAEKETRLYQLQQLLSFREAQTQGLSKEVERQAERIVALQSENARLMEENLRLTLETQTEGPSSAASEGAEAIPAKNQKRLVEERRILIDNVEGYLRIRYAYDDTGKASAMQIIDKNGSVLETSSYTYDEEDRLLSVRSVGSSGQERMETYDYREHETIKIEFREGKALRAIQKIEKNPTGQTIRVTTYDAKGALTYTEERFHEGELLKRTDGYDATGKRVRQTLYAYDGENRLTQITIKEGNEIKWLQTFDYAITGEPEKTSLYDSKGTLIEYTEYLYAP
ncbi:MAG TPA: hypothetical protein PLP59_02620 [Thermotogota bacterium]|nr:hypothetical protein [Thermotogota bacterium]